MEHRGNVKHRNFNYFNAPPLIMSGICVNDISMHRVLTSGRYVTIIDHYHCLKAPVAQDLCSLFANGSVFHSVYNACTYVHNIMVCYHVGVYCGVSVHATCLSASSGWMDWVVGLLLDIEVYIPLQTW